MHVLSMSPWCWCEHVSRRFDTWSLCWRLWNALALAGAAALWLGRSPVSSEAHHPGKELAGALSLHPDKEALPDCFGYHPRKGACRGHVLGGLVSPIKLVCSWSSSRQGKLVGALVTLVTAS